MTQQAAAVTPPSARPAVPTTSAGPPAPVQRDPRITALRRFAISITVFTIVGHLLLGFEQAYLTPVTGVLTAYVLSLGLEAIDARLNARRPAFAGPAVNLVNFLLPAHIAGLACAMLLYGNENLWPTIFAVTVAVCSKYIVRIRIDGRLRHVLNPSNAGISATLLLFPWVSIAPPYEFTERVDGVLDWLIPLAILAAGTMINAKLTRRMALILAWVGGFVLQAVLRAVLVGDSLPSALLAMSGVAFVLFTNYMITDPGTTPVSRHGQVVFGLAAALTYGLLVALGVTFGLFFALVLTCLGRMVVIVVAERRRAAMVRAHD